MFSEYFGSLKIDELLGSSCPERAEVENFLTAPTMSLKQLAQLIIAGADETVRRLVLEKARRKRAAVWRNKLFLMPPLYISNGDKEKGGCLDSCLYCPWHNGNLRSGRIRRLNIEDVGRELKFLFQCGYRDVEFVSATDPALFNSKKAAEYVNAAKAVGMKNVGLNFFPLKNPAAYSELLKAGCTFSIIWQETYSSEVYQKMHPRGPKSNMKYRLDAPERALSGGIKTAGLAFLGGLADWRPEVLSTIAHARYLQEECGANIIFGMPRWKKGKGTLIQPLKYDDQEYEFVGALYSLALPDSLVWFSTRENFELSAKAARGGGCIFTLDCSTEVGGYLSRAGAPQFPVFSYSYDVGVKRLEKLGFKIETNLPFKR